MYEIASVGYWQGGDWKKGADLLYRAAEFVPRLPHIDELGTFYSRIVYLAQLDRDLRRAQKWQRHLEETAAALHDWQWQAIADQSAGQLLAGRWEPGEVLAGTGDLQGAVVRDRQTLQATEKMGDDHRRLAALRHLGYVYILQGLIRDAESTVQELRELGQASASKSNTASVNWQLALIALTEEAWPRAASAYTEALRLFLDIGNQFAAAATLAALGHVYLVQHDAGEALRCFQEAFARAGSDWLKRDPFDFFRAMSGLEGAWEAEGKKSRFRAFGRRNNLEHPEVQTAGLVQWSLEPAVVEAQVPARVRRDQFDAALSAEWVWHDPLGGSAFVLREGLEVRAANGRDLWHTNLSAPRLLQLGPEGDFGLEATLAPVSEDLPAIGGLLLWQDEEHYLRLDRGTRGPREISFQGRIGDQDVVIGRGRIVSAREGGGLPVGRVLLRLERASLQVRALCSADGTQWFSVGEVTFPVAGPIRVGLHAIGMIDRTIYHGAFPGGTGVRFESFKVWSK